MTNTRRKTFATPLEFWQWALGHHCRTAQDIDGDTYWVRILPNGISAEVRSGGSLEVPSWPLTAVEDEHGVIEEEKPDQLLQALKDTRDLSSWEESLATAIRKEIDERIAAATVWQESVNGLPEEMKHYILKPKGD